MVYWCIRNEIIDGGHEGVRSQGRESGLGFRALEGWVEAGVREGERMTLSAKKPAVL
jgi:hypothetical protein